MSYDAIRDMFKDILEIEQIATDLYEELANETTIPELKNLLNGIKEDEIKHAVNAKKMLEILES